MRNELKSMIENVQQAWLLVRGKLQTYGMQLQYLTG